MQLSTAGRTVVVRDRGPPAGGHYLMATAFSGDPAAPVTGQVITGATTDFGPDVTVFHAGTAEREGRLVTAGGRVLTVVGRGTTHAEAMRRAYAAVEAITFEGMQYRRDIGEKALVI